MSVYLLLFMIFTSCLVSPNSSYEDEPINFFIVIMARGATTNAQLDLKISPKLRTKFECLDDTCSGTLKNNLKHFTSPIRIIGHTLNDTTSPRDLQLIRNKIQKIHTTRGYKLQAVIVIGDFSLLSMFSVYMVGVDVSILGLDTSGLIISNHYQESNFLRLNKRLNYLNPEVDKLSDILNNFKEYHRLQRIHLFVSSNHDYQSIKLSSGKLLFDSVYNVSQLNMEMKLLINTSNDLVVFKCQFKKLEEILCKYGRIREKYYPFNLAEGAEFKRSLIWIPTDKQPTGDQLICQNHSFRIFRLSFRFDVDSCLSSLVDYLIVNENSALQNERINWGGKLYLQNIMTKKDEGISGQSDYKPKRKKGVKKSFRILLKHVEPYLIVSRYFEPDRAFYEKTGECKDGLQCLEISNKRFDKPDNLIMNYTLPQQEFVNFFKKELLIDLINHGKLEAGFSAINNSHVIRKCCCTGYIINLLRSLAIELDFNMDLYFVRQGKFGWFNEHSGQWNGAIGHVVTEIAHIAAGPFSLTADRARAIDFSVPFLHSSHALLFKHENKRSHDLFMFLQPFPTLHLIYLALVAMFSAVSMSLLEFISPFGLNPRGRMRARNYTLGSGISMAISLMFNHTMPFKSPKSWAGKWTQNFIAIYAICFIAQYTAQMASILSAGDMLPDTNDIYDTESVGMRQGFIGSSSISSNLCHTQNSSHCYKGRQVESDDEGIKLLINGSLDVYLSDYLSLDYMVFKQTDCSLNVRAKNFTTNGYALSLSRNLVSDLDKKLINIKLLEYYEKGFSDELYIKWFKKRVTCNRKPGDDKIRIDLQQYKGVFLYVLIGIGLAVVVLFFEQALYKWTIPYLRNKPRKSEWKSLKLMFISQRFYRIVHSIEFFDASNSAKEFLNVFKRRDFEAIFQKSFRKKQLEQTSKNKLQQKPKLWALIEASTEKPYQKHDDESEQAIEIVNDSLIAAFRSVSDSETDSQKQENELFSDHDFKNITRLNLRDYASTSYSCDFDTYEKFITELDLQIGTPVIEEAEKMNIADSSAEDLSEKVNPRDKITSGDSFRLIKKIFGQI